MSESQAQGHIVAHTQLQERTVKSSSPTPHLVLEGIAEIPVGLGSVVTEVWGEVLVNSHLHRYFGLHRVCTQDAQLWSPLHLHLSDTTTSTTLTTGSALCSSPWSLRTSWTAARREAGILR